VLLLHNVIIYLLTEVITR